MKLNQIPLVLALCSYPVLASAQTPVPPNDVGEVNQILNKMSQVNRPLTCSLNHDLDYVCDSMSKLACKPGTFDDGTGRVLSDSDFSAKVDPIKVKVKKLYQDSVDQMLLNPGAKFNLLREMAIKATKQDGTPDCLSKNKAELGQCYKRVSKIIADKKVNSEFGSYNGSENIHRTDIDFDIYTSLSNNQAFKDSIDLAHR